MTVSGGFAQTDLGSDILSFACCYFRADKYDSVTLRQTHSSSVGMNLLPLAIYMLFLLGFRLLFNIDDFLLPILVL